jgi:hypothetical protein
MSLRWTALEFLASNGDYGFVNLQRLLFDPDRLQYIGNLLRSLINDGHVSACILRYKNRYHLDSEGIEMLSSQKRLLVGLTKENSIQLANTNPNFKGDSLTSVRYPKLNCCCIKNKRRNTETYQYFPLERLIIYAKPEFEVFIARQKVYPFPPISPNNPYIHTLENPHLYCLQTPQYAIRQEETVCIWNENVITHTEHLPQFEQQQTSNIDSNQIKSTKQHSRQHIRWFYNKHKQQQIKKHKSNIQRVATPNQSVRLSHLKNQSLLM